MDLSRASDDSVELILLRVPAKDLLASCALVSTQWNRILSSMSFWLSWAELRNYRPQWRHFLPNLSLHSIRQIAVRRPFGRNFVRDAWDMSKLGSAECFVADPRWTFNSKIVWTEDDTGHRARIEIPPVFLDGPKVWRSEDGTEEERVDECVAISFQRFEKQILIKLADEGLTDEILDNFTPPIVVSELVANRRDCGSVYTIMAGLMVSDPRHDRLALEGPPQMNCDLFTHQWEEERWHKIEYVFRNYPKGMRYLLVFCTGRDRQFWAGNYGPKMAKLTVKALCQFDDK